ncbi:hypothetical protein PSEUDO9AG_50296 [Pseudomonas sp. 9Ag]|nr:hypothetical protein PSEUDO9AG_50296 [Pseudomonas sp. 9Ag]
MYRLDGLHIPPELSASQVVETPALRLRYAASSRTPLHRARLRFNHKDPIDALCFQPVPPSHHAP